VNVEQTYLLKYLQKGDPVYYGQVLKLKERITGFLEYTRQSFPTYTTHSISHSEEIISQLSQLLFTDDKPDEPVVKLSMAEVYILAVAAYLHDAGMVISDAEKAKILTSEEWKLFTSGDNPGAKRRNSIETFREGSIPKDKEQRDFLADVQLRFLIAQFLRKTHSKRVSDIITQNRSNLGDFIFGNQILERTIVDVCVAHGLSQHELLDTERFPDRRGIRGETVNVRFLALLLRIGDLLDMRIDRACPLLLNAACPIPSDSLAHWTQYEGIAHQLTAPDMIEFTANCNNQSEHRFLEVGVIGLFQR
jgi:molecular chaperone HtpG